MRLYIFRYFDQSYYSILSHLTHIKRCVNIFDWIGVKQLLLVFFLFGAASAFAQGDRFIIEGRLKVDGGSVSDAKIIVERDGRQVKSIEGESRFEIELDFQSIYIISFVKEGFVTKRLRFDTNVPKDRIEYGFEPFGFQVEIFEQYDDVNMVVFNQPVGKISYSELIDEFDYDTDYTKSIQSQLDQAQEEVAQAKQKKQEEAVKNEKKIDELTNTASGQAKDGNYTAAVKSLEEAQKLSKDPAIKKQIEEYKKAEQEQKKQQQFEEVVKEAEAAMAAGDLDEAKRLFEQANGVIGGDKKVQSQLAKIEEEKSAQQQQAQAYEAATKSAQDALKAGNYDQAIAKAKEAMKVKSSPEMEALIANAEKAQAEAEAAAAAEAEKEENYQQLLAEADKAMEAGDLDAARDKYEEAKAVIAKPELEERLKAVQQAVAQQEAEQKKQAEAKAALDESIKAAETALAAGDLQGAKAALDKARGLGEDDRIAELAKGVAEQEERLAQEAKAAAEQEEQINTALAEADAALASGDLDKAASAYQAAGDLGADAAKVKAGMDKVEAERERIAAEAAAEAEAAAQQKAQMDALIAEAQAALDASDYKTATAKLDEAAALGSDDRIADIRKAVDKAEAEEMKAAKKEGEIQQEYNDLVAEGNAALAEASLDDAEKAFNKALALLDGPEAQAGLTQVEEAKAAKAEEEAAAAAAQEQQERQQQYDDLVAKAQAALDADDLAKAEANFSEALNFSDDPAAAEAGLEAVKERRSAMSAAEAKAAEEAAAAKQAEEQAKVFAEAVVRGDEAAASERYDDAIQAYGEALGIKKDADVQSKLDDVLEKKSDAEAQASATQSEQEKAAVEQKRLEEEAAKAAAEKAEAERLAAEQAQQSDEAAKRAALEEAAAIELARKQEAFDAEKAEAERLLKQNKLNEARVAYERALDYFPNDADVKKRIAQIDELKDKLAREKENTRDAAVAITDNRGRETEQLANIIAEEEKKSGVNDIAPGEVKMAQAVMEQDVRPGAGNKSPVIISDVKVGDAARQTRSAQMTDDEKYDGIAKRSDEQQKEKAADDEQGRLMETYRQRKTVETDSVDNTFVTRIFINNGQFVTTYKKVQHSWGGVYYFIDGRATNRRFWEHETQ